MENRIFKSYYERHASEAAADADDDKRKTNRQRRRQLPTMLTIDQKVEIGVHEQEVAHKDVSNACIACAKLYAFVSDEMPGDTTPREMNPVLAAGTVNVIR